MTDEQKNAWSVIGGLCGTNWDRDFPMTDKGGDIYESEALKLHAGEELKCRWGKSWSVSVPFENVIVSADGAYIVRLNVSEGSVELIAR